MLAAVLNRGSLAYRSPCQFITLQSTRCACQSRDLTQEEQIETTPRVSYNPQPFPHHPNPVENQQDFAPDLADLMDIPVLGYSKSENNNE